ncbi:heavy-metal-associated domain-containing protein [Aquibacillus saliphilus]|uniref:heavy-metal-associated domain-containing protein n=1 Tax=Aquibacillus saliphilus TaxID=1909422 RepID=UPI001CF017CD|nr:heavy-metal-associated domain-containing protein [Aquibacillus saliphilus]
MKKVRIQLKELTCPSYINKIENALPKLIGVFGVEVLYHSDEVEVVYEETVIQFTEIEEIVRDLGFKVLGRKINTNKNKSDMSGSVA